MKNMKGILGVVLPCMAALVMTACGNKVCQKTAGGVVVTPLDGSAKVRVEVYGDKLIRVSATEDKKFAKDASLIIVAKVGGTGYSVSESEEAVTVSTSALSAVVSKADGKVAFTGPDGTPITAEDARWFEPVEVEGTTGYSVRQAWTTTEDEAFYGLGQHQANELNYKGKNEELYQYNTKVSLPFIVSSHGYGVLWDNYSLTRYGDPRDYAQLGEAFKIYDKDGAQGSISSIWTAADGTVLQRSEPFLYFDNLRANAEYLPKEISLDGAKVTFDGYLEPSESGTYRFLLYYAGYTTVYLGGEEVVPERWRTAWNPNSYKFTYDFTAGTRVPLHIEWLPDGGESYHALRALTPVPKEEQDKPAFWSEVADMIDYYFIAGEDIDEVVSGYRTLTGKSQIMPKWAMGYWQSRERYVSQAQLLENMKEFRTRDLPIDNIVQDWSYWPEDGWGSHEFDLDRFPDAKAMVDSVHAMNGHIMISVWPKFYTETEHYKEFDSQGWMYQQSVVDSLRDWIGQGYTYSFYDAYSEGARKLFWQQMKDHLYPLGFDAWWMDASEPNVRDCTPIDYRKALCGPTALGPSAKYFNAYALMNAMAIYGGQREADNDTRVFLLTRSGFPGLQRYSTATWSGDIATRWEDMRAQITAGLNFAICGIPYWTMDIGGFCVEKRYEEAYRVFLATGVENADMKEWRELNTRWFQFGAFCPLFRVHGQYPPREPWNIAPENHPAYKSWQYYLKLRYDLMPYIYSLAGMTYREDYTIMRALVMDFAADENVYDVDNQFMFGPAFMACPVAEYGLRQREVYFPEGTWYDFYSGSAVVGGQTAKVSAPYERMPLFVREGSIVPFGPDMQYSDEKVADEITLFVYAGRDGSFTLYEDEGTNYNYEKGLCAVIPFSYDDSAKTLTIGEREGSFEGMLTERSFNVVYVSASTPVAYNKAAKGTAVRYDGSAQTIQL